MVRILNEQERRVALQDPQTYWIVTTHIAADRERLDAAVYTPFTRRFPSLRSMADQMRSDEVDPLDDIARIEEMKAKRGVVRGLEVMAEIFGAKKSDTRLYRTLVECADEMIAVYEEARPHQETLYVQLADAVRDVSGRFEVGPGTVVHELPYRDEVSRQVFPDRFDAELFLGQNRAFVETAFRLGSRVREATKRSALVRDTAGEYKHVLQLIQFPTSGAFEALQEGVWDYRMGELDRVYGSE